MNNQMEKYVGNLLEITNQSINAFVTGDLGLGYNKIIEVIEQTLLMVREVEKEANIDNTNYLIITETNHVLNQITEALVGRDSVLISDLLEYEFIPVVEKWKAI